MHVHVLPSHADYSNQTVVKEWCNAYTDVIDFNILCLLPWKPYMK